MKIEFIKVIDRNTEVDRITVTHINGLRLVRIADFVRIGIEKRQTLYTHIRDGKLHVYHPNGRRKQTTSNTPACVCLNEWEEMYQNYNDNSTATYRVRIIKPQAKTATESPRA